MENLKNNEYKLVHGFYSFNLNQEEVNLKKNL